MAHVHDHYSGGSTTVVESDRVGPATVLVVLIGLVILGALIWFFAFSGVIFSRSSDNSPDINIRNQNPPAQNNNTNTNPETGTQPNPVPS